MKKLDLYLLRQFFPVFVMTFLICLLIVEMQFTWKHITDLVGKGIGLSIFAEFFLYSSASLVPMALPLAILLASLMTFGNLGENFELTAMKSAGISLFRIMLPLIISISMICIGAFFFSNNILPKAQTKLYTLIFSLRQKSPELEIPPGEFYDGINGYHIYVESKDSKGWLKNIMIYDFSRGFQNAGITLADSGKIAFTADKKYLMLTLLHGEGFENLKNQRMSYSSTAIPYRRETFIKKEILLDFNTDFDRYDESILKDEYVSKNFKELLQTIDSVQNIVDKQTVILGKELIAHNYLGRERMPNIQLQTAPKSEKSENFNSIFQKMNSIDRQRVVSETMNIVKQKKEANMFNSVGVESDIFKIRRHQIELYRKFTLSFACLIFFFIGAPLGAIIRKGGLGMPIVVSVVMFIIYYIIDNTGFKMAREGLWDAWRGMWLSSAVLLPAGIFLTYKAAKDSELFRNEAYMKAFLKFSKTLILAVGGKTKFRKWAKRHN
ncbi:MAG: LptF/LptG family permease [Paludibacter sp.]|nr:LptF/LptG family permease [Paludibacter sp.]